MMDVELRYFAAARAARGTNSETLTVPDGTTIERLLVHIRGSHPPEAASAREPRDSIAAVLARCSFLVNALATNDRAHVLRDGDTVDVLPPFAGG